MSDSHWHVSSAVISIEEGAMEAVISLIREMKNVEIHARHLSRIIVTIEGESTRDLGDQLTNINLMQGVLTANMVFEHAEEVEKII